MKEIDKTLAILQETAVDVNGRSVRCIEYESAPEGRFVKICTWDHQLGVDAEYAWLEEQYGGFIPWRQELSIMILNGNKVPCDIQIIETETAEKKTVYFDISQMMTGLDEKKAGIVNKDHWEEKARAIYEKLISEFNFSRHETDEESLYKQINAVIKIGFDIKYYFGFILQENIRRENKKLYKTLKQKCLAILETHESSGFINTPFVIEEIIGGYIRIDDFPSIDIVFEKYKEIETAAQSIDSARATETKIPLNE